MTLQPIVKRELAIAARNNTARRVRLWTTVIGAVVGAGMLLFAGRAGTASGMGLFTALSGYTFGLALLSGVFLTSDSLSAEKRNGTMGLLFLTDLESRDVVFGKLAARALNPLLALIAMLPVISISLLIGGVTAGEFWRMTLALMASLWLSLTAGLFISAISYQAQKAAAATLLLMVSLLLLFPMLTFLTAGSVWKPLFQALSLQSPFACFTLATEQFNARKPGAFWISLTLVVLTGAAFVAAAALRLRRAWRDDPLADGKATAVQMEMRRRRGELGDRNPVLWLMRDGDAVRFAIWSVAMTGAALAGGSLLINSSLKWPLAFYSCKAVAFLLKILFAGQAARFFVESRATGAMELLLCTPLTDRDLVKVQWRQLRGLFMSPLALFLIPACAIMFSHEIGVVGGAAQNEWLPMMNVTAFGSAGTMFVLSTVTEFLALGEVAMWLSLSLKRPALAPGLAVVIVLLVPMFFICVPDVYYDLVLIAWARHNLSRNFRARLSEQFAG